jgi:hypothetical protein
MPMDETSDINTATRVFTETFIRTMKGFGLISSFRAIANLGLKSSSDQIHNYWRGMMDALVYDPDFKGILTPIDPDSPIKRISSRTVAVAAQLEMKNFGVAVDAASLIFAHSILDDAALQYCRVTSIVAPSSWEPFMANKPVSLEEVRKESYQNLLKAKIEDSLKKLERDSLLTKINKAFQICQPRSDFQPIRGFSFDRNRLKNLDRFRNAIIHETGPVHSLPKGDDDLFFMSQCAVYLMAMVHHCFGVTMPEELIEQLGRGVSL